jgi:hypothetical protein
MVRFCHRLLPALGALTLGLPAAAAENVSTGGRVETDLYTNDESPPGALLDGSTQTHFAQHRLDDSEWRVWLRTPALLESVSLVQGWKDWSQALEVTLEAADGSMMQLALSAGTRELQTFPVTFPSATAFVDVRVRKAQPAQDGGGWGGFAEMQFTGVPAGTDTTPPQISAIEVERHSDTSATVRWRTDEPATTQLRYSTEAAGAEATPADLSLTTSHSVSLQAASALRGRLELRSADASGNRAEIRHDAFVTIDTTYQYGAGGWSFHLGGTWIAAPQVYADDGVPHKFTQAWIGGDGWEQWFKAAGVAEMQAAGVTPEVIHYYFGDPVLEDVQARRDAFLADIDRLAEVLAASGVGQHALVTLEPEYNQGKVATWEGWNDLMLEAIHRLHSKAGAKVGLLPGDWDIDHVLPISMGRAAAAADFVAFQEMRASTQDTPAQAKQVVSNAIRFARYLSRKFLRPVRWGYVMVSDYGGWTWVQRDVVVELCERQKELQAAGVVAVSWMSYLDHPGADGYFGEGEAHKGLKFEDGRPKPAFEVWKECVLHGPSWVGTGQAAPGAPLPAESDGCSCGLRRQAPACWLALLAAAWAVGRWRRSAGR